MDNPIVLKTCVHSYEAYLAKGLLNSHGIEAEVVAEDASGGLSQVTAKQGSYQLLVDQNHRSAALEILKTQPLDADKSAKKDGEEDNKATYKAAKIRAWVIILLILCVLSALFGISNPVNLGYQILRLGSFQKQPVRKCTSKYREGVKYKTCKAYFLTGEIRFQDEFKGKWIAHGHHRQFYQNGSLRHVSEFINGEQVGKEFYYWRNGKVSDEINYLAGGSHQIIHTYYPTGELWSTIHFRNGQLNGDLDLYNRKGEIIEHLVAINDIIQDKHGKTMHGSVQHDYEKNRPMMIDNYLDGQLNGYQLRYWDNGNLMVKCWYTKGQRNGECNEYYEDGTINLRMEFRNGELSWEDEYDGDGRIIFFTDYLFPKES